MERSGATSIFPLDDPKSNTIMRNTQASAWVNTGGAGTYASGVTEVNGTKDVSALNTQLEGPTILNDGQLSMNVDAGELQHYSGSGAALGGVGTLAPGTTHPGHTLIDGLPFSLEIWVKLSALDSTDDDPAWLLSLIDADGFEAHLGFARKNVTGGGGPGGAVAGDYYTPCAKLRWTGDAYELTPVWSMDTTSYYHQDWTQLVAVWGAGGRCRLYLDGREIANGSAGTNVPANQIQVRVNKPGAANRDCLKDGSLAYAATYNTALTGDRIRRHYLAARRVLDITIPKKYARTHHHQPNGTERYCLGVRTTNDEDDQDDADSKFRGSGITTNPSHMNIEQFQTWKMTVLEDILERSGGDDPNLTTGVSMVGMFWATKAPGGTFPRTLVDFTGVEVGSMNTNWTDPSGYIDNPTYSPSIYGGFHFVLQVADVDSYTLECKWGHDDGRTEDLTNDGEYHILTLTDGSDNVIPLPQGDANRNGVGHYEGFHHGGGTSNGDWRLGRYTFGGFSAGGGENVDESLSHIHMSVLGRSNVMNTKTIDVVAVDDVPTPPALPWLNTVYTWGRDYDVVTMGAMQFDNTQYPDTNTDDVGNPQVIETFHTHMALFPRALSRVQLRSLERLARGTRQMRSRRPTQHLTRFSTILSPIRLKH